MLYEVITNNITINADGAETIDGAGSIVNSFCPVCVDGDVVDRCGPGFVLDSHHPSRMGSSRREVDHERDGDCGIDQHILVPRITSYNVCYTKLLRYEGNYNSPVLGYFEGDYTVPFDLCLQWHLRITSYNVCYTKLLRLAVYLKKIPP